MKTLLFKLASSTFTLGLIASAHSAHWIVRSMVSSSSSSSDISVTRNAPSGVSVTIPSGSTMIYGSGTFSFFGENDTYSKKFLCANPGTVTYNPWCSSYYTYTYQWVSDSPTDVPPAVSTPGEVLGYSLEQGGVGQNFEWNPTGGYVRTLGTWSGNLAFNSQGDVFGGTGESPYSALGIYWPTLSDSPTVTIGSSLFYVRPENLGGGSVTTDANGYTILIASVLNSQSIELSTPLSYNNPVSSSFFVFDTGTTTCYKGGTELLGLPIES